METDLCWVQFFKIFITEPWLIAFTSSVFAFIATVIAVFIGNRLTIQLQKQRTKAIEKGLINEFKVMSSYFEAWLKELVDEFQISIRASYSKAIEFDMSYIDALVIELIAANHIPTIDQRQLILNLKRKNANIKEYDKLRNNKVEAKKNFKEKLVIPKGITALLIIDAVEVIYIIDRYIKDKEKFRLDPRTTRIEMAECAFLKAGIVFDKEIWDKISKFLLEV